MTLEKIQKQYALDTNITFTVYQYDSHMLVPIATKVALSNLKDHTNGTKIDRVMFKNFSEDQFCGIVFGEGLNKYYAIAA
jgi:hypothetical protein